MKNNIKPVAIASYHKGSTSFEFFPDLKLFEVSEYSFENEPLYTGEQLQMIIDDYERELEKYKTEKENTQ